MRSCPTRRVTGQQTSPKGSKMGQPLMTPASTPASWLAGYIPDIPTPFDENGVLDLAAFARLCERQINAGVSAMLDSETCGEAST